MSVSGSLRTMPVPELFQWTGQNRKSGMLSISKGRNTIRFRFREGRISGCSSNDPPAMLGQFLLSRGKIDEKALKEALAEQEREHRNLGEILVERGALSEEELRRYVSAKAEETIYKLFEWDDAHFEFTTATHGDVNMIEVNLSVDDVLLRGAQRRDELDRMKSLFDNPGIVLRHTKHRLHPETAGTPMARRIYELIDGKRTLGEILLLSHASEFLAIKFLYQLYKRGIIAFKDVQQIAPEPGTPAAACELALGLLSRGEHEAALETLHTAQRDEPASDAVQRTLQKVEAAYLEHAYQSDLAPHRVPVAVVRSEDRSHGQPLTSGELFLLDLMAEGAWDVKSLVQIAPLHEIDAVRGLKSLLSRGLIELRGEDARPTAELPSIDEEPATAGASDEDSDLDIDIAESVDGILGTVRD